MAGDGMCGRPGVIQVAPGLGCGQLSVRAEDPGSEQTQTAQKETSVRTRKEDTRSKSSESLGSFGAVLPRGSGAREAVRL